MPVTPPRITGMIHLLPLPGAPGFAGSVDAVRERALADAAALAEAGVDALMVENYGDVPFHREARDPVTVAVMTHLVAELRREVPLPLGVQVLRNDAIAALAIAAATGAAFIRVNVLSGVMVSDQGIIEGCAAELMRLRARIAPDIAVWADVFVKHATPLGSVSLADAVRDTVERGCADAVIVSGTATGSPADPDDIRTVRSASTRPVIIGSGVTEDSVADLLAMADAVIVGTAVKRDGITTNPVDPVRARAVVARASTR